MEEFDFEETNMSTSIDKLRKKKSELDDEKPYNVIRNNLYDELNTKSQQKIQSEYVPENVIPKQKQTIKKTKRNRNKRQQQNNYYNLFIFAIIFLLVNNYELNTYLVQHRYGYYTIVIIKLILFIVINYIYKRFMK
jgi:hypothetical protein